MGVYCAGSHHRRPHWCDDGSSSRNDAMPELVALLHSFVGLAAVLVGFASYVDAKPAHRTAYFLLEVFLDVFIGAITFTGSVVAYLKLKGTLSGKPLLLPGRHLINLAMVGGSAYWVMYSWWKRSAS